MPPKNTENCQLYMQTPEGYEPLGSVGSEICRDYKYFSVNSENAMKEFVDHIQAAIKLIMPVIEEVIQILDGIIEPYKVNEMLHPRKKPRGSIRRSRGRRKNERTTC